MDISGIIFFVIIIGLLFFCCGLCMQTKDRGAIFSSPVVITGQSHQPVNQPGVAQQPYPIQTQINTTSGQPHVYNPVPTTTPYPTGPSMMPAPQLPVNPTGYAPYPNMGGAPYPTSNSPYPPNPTTYAPNNPSVPYPMSNAPYPPAPQLAMNPPPYNEVVGTSTYEKQSPYNPNFSG